VCYALLRASPPVRPKPNPKLKISEHVLRHCGLIPKHGLGDLPKVEGSPTVVCPKAIRLLAEFVLPPGPM
jgi:hypothetical protein